MRRTVLAAVLLAAAVILPCSAWYVVGTRALEREARDLVAAPAADAARTAARLAERTRERLRSVARIETDRPWYQYRHAYPDLTENCECAGWIESPLARGPADPFVLAHFEVDPSLRLRLPTVVPEGEEGPPPSREQAALSERLRRQSPRIVRTMWPDGQPPRPAFAGASAVAAGPVGPDGAPAVAAAADSDAVLVMWGGSAAEVGPFRWRTVELDGRPELIAVRSVRSPEGSRLQGILISREAVAKSLAGDPPAELRPRGAGEAATASRADSRVTEPLDLPGVEWEVAVDAGDSVVEARQRAEALRGDFRKLFWGGSGAAFLAAVLVVGLVGQAERLAKQRSRFAASAAHELRTPLAGLRVYGEMLADDLGDPGESREYARRIATEADRLGRVVSNVLGYSRLERGASTVRPEPCDPGELTREAAERIRPALEASDAALEVEAPDGLPRTPVDRDAFFQIVQNLADNAERYSRGAEDRTVRIAVEARDGGGVTLSVADRGPGVPAVQRKKLFRPFARGADPDGPAGLGLGLAMVAELARGHGGQASYSPREGGGSVFLVTFPGGAVQ
jgi:signal transduction histidine kinase